MKKKNFLRSIAKGFKILKRKNNNTGSHNSGKCNSSDRNSGNHNSFFGNSGNYNSGCHNSGNYNSGSHNMGSWNSGDWNGGNYNTGNHNTGSHNSGHYNIGSWNSGDWNSASFSNGCFNTKVPKIMMFDRPSDWTTEDWLNSEAKYILEKMPSKTLKWVLSIYMTDEEKELHPEHQTTGGYLKVSDPEESAQMWFDKERESEHDEINTQDIPKVHDAGEDVPLD